MGIELKGMNSLIQKLNALGGNVEDCLYRGIGKSVSFIESDAKDLCPVDHGELRDSINSKVEKTSSGIKGSVGTNKEYAAYVEFGTGKKGEESNTNKKPNVSYKQDKWKVNIPGVGVRWIDGQPAQPYLYPALMQNKDTVKELCVQELNAEIRRLGDG